jgi:hypothetical protein
VSLKNRIGGIKLPSASARRCGKTGAAVPVREAFTPAPKRAYAAGARTVGEFLPSVAKPAFERYGFALVEILQHWAAYAGKDMAAYTAPEKLKWPRAAMNGEVSEGATLILRVDGPRIVEVQHHIPQLIERLNTAFGYRAITAIRLLQAPLTGARPRNRAAPVLKTDESAFGSVADGKLRAALARMSAGVCARQARSPDT